MGISSALSSALAGLRLSQGGLGLVSQNVASANTEGYTRKVLQPSTRVAAGQVIGVNTDNVSRVLDTLLQGQLRTERAAGVYTTARASALERVDAFLGPPGSPNALESLYNTFTNSFQDLLTSPDSDTARSLVLTRAQTFTARLNSISDDIQQLRLEAESGISNNVRHANDVLQNIEELNRQILSQTIGNNLPVQLMDSRDRAIDELSQIMDIKVTINSENSATIYTSSGVLLFDRVAAHLSFDEHSSISAASVYSVDPNLRAVGTINLRTPSGYEVDLISQKAFKAGYLGAYVSLRDEVLPEVQSMLDELASGVALALSTRTQAGTAATAGAQTGFDLNLTDVAPGDSIKLTVRSGATTRTINFFRVEDASQLPLDAEKVAGVTGEVHGLSFSNLSTLASDIQAVLGSGFTVSAPGGSTLRFLDDGAPNTTDISAASARISAQSLTAGEGALAFFTDIGSSPPYYAANVEGQVQKVGFAGRMRVNEALLLDPSKLVNMTSSATYNAGDATRPRFMLDALTKTAQVFAPVDGVVGTTTSAVSGNFLQNIINRVALAAENEKSIAEGQEVVVNGIEDRFDSSSRVNVDEEMAKLIEYQQLYQASARILNIANEMIQELMNAAR